MYRTVFLLLSSCWILGCSSGHSGKLRLPYYNEPDFTPLFLTNADSIQQKITHHIDSFALLNQDSIIITNRFVKGKIQVANFIFTSCGSICPVMTKHLKMVSDALQNDPRVVFLSFSVTPWIDRPAKLKKYMQRNDIQNSNWQFLTGNKSAIYTLARRSYFAEEDLGFTKDSTEFLHTEHFILADPQQRIRGIYNGTLEVEMKQLLEDIRTLEEEGE